MITEIFKKAREGEGINLTAEQYSQFDLYTELLLSWNEKMNLTAIKDEEGIAIKHFLDSLLLYREGGIKTPCTLIDVGTGAGFPAVPLKIFNSHIDITLLDSLNKRITFLNELTCMLGMHSTAIHGRAEELGDKPQHREKYDYATARAVAHLRELAEYCLPFVKLGGSFLAMKSGDIDTELAEAQNAIAIMGGRVEDVRRFSLPDGSARSVVIIKKVSPTPAGYPRPSAKIAKKPL